VTSTSIADRASVALKKTMPSEEADALLKQVRREALGMKGKVEAARAASLDPHASTAQAQARRAEAADLQFEADRLGAIDTALAKRVDELRQAEEYARQQFAHDAALKERDELAADIAAEYPVIVRRLTELVKRINDSDDRCKRVGIYESAEALGRGIPANFRDLRGPLPRIAETLLPMPADVTLAWESTFAGFRWNGLTLPAPDAPTIEEEAA
jgi:ClpP class serine protease